MNFGDIFRNFTSAVDEQFIEATGRRLIYYQACYAEDNKDQACYIEDKKEVLYRDVPIEMRGFYEIPSSNPLSVFGGELDEMDIELGYNTVVQKLGKPPAIADLVVDCIGAKWKVVQISRKDDNIRGQNRLILTVRRFISQ